MFLYSFTFFVVFGGAPRQTGNAAAKKSLTEKGKHFFLRFYSFSFLLLWFFLYFLQVTKSQTTNEI